MAVETMKEDKGGAAQALEFHTGIALNFRQTHAWVCASEDPECFDITMFKFKVYHQKSSDYIVEIFEALCIYSNGSYAGGSMGQREDLSTQPSPTSNDGHVT